MNAEMKENLNQFLKGLMELQRKCDVYLDGEIELVTRSGFLFGSLEPNYNQIDVYDEDQDKVIASYKVSDK